MIVARGTVITTASGSSVIQFEYPECIGCTNQCPRNKRNEYLYPEPLPERSIILLNIPASGLSIALFILLGVPVLIGALSFTVTRSVLWACVSMTIAVLANIGVFRRFSIADYLLRPTIRRIG